MRQSRDGVTQIVDRARARRVRPRQPFARVLLAATRWSGSCAPWPGCGSSRGSFNWSADARRLRRGSAISPLLPRALQGAIVFFAAVDLLAAVGLWLAAPWGGVLWLLCASIEAISPALGVRGAASGALGVVLNVMLVALYFFLSWRAESVAIG